MGFIHCKKVGLALGFLILIGCTEAGLLGVLGVPTLGINELVIPPLIEGDAGTPIELTLSDSQHEFFPGVSSQTKSFSSASDSMSYLGPTIKLVEGTDTTIRFQNDLSEATTVHGHGLHVTGDIDGGPQGMIGAGAPWEITIPTRQQAGTSWYHPHLMGTTAEHVHAGLAGLYIIEDANSQNLPLPKTYGVDDIPLIVQDRSFVGGAMVAYAPTPDQIMNGLREDTLVVNGVIRPYQSVPQGWVRLRLLNGANARSFRFFFEGDRPFYFIATEGGFVEEPFSITSLDLMPGERAEIMVDLASEVASVRLLAAFLNQDAGGNTAELPTQLVVELRPLDTLPAVVTPLPASLATFTAYDNTAAQRTRNFSLEMNDDGDGAGGNPMGLMSINGLPMNLSTINERVPRGVLERWRIQGEEMAHPFHVHGTSFQVISIGGNEPPLTSRGWKDTVIVEDGWTDVLVRFDYEAPESFPYMYHCHILEHEDAGMMGQFTVQ